eukprot:scaffold69462_cov39-Prasinocladus_malaysianus.AAC.1
MPDTKQPFKSIKLPMSDPAVPARDQRCAARLHLSLRRQTGRCLSCGGAGEGRAQRLKPRQSQLRRHS